MKKHKILFIARKYPSSKNPIAGIFIKEHAKAVSLYEEVIVITAEYDRGLENLYRINSTIEDGIRVLRVSYRKSPIPKTTYFIYLWAILATFRTIRKEGWVPDIIHAHIYSEGVPAIILKKLYGIPVVVSEHFSSFPRGMIRGFEKIKAIFALNNANLVISVSRNLVEHLKLFGIKNRFIVIPNTVDTKVFYPPVEKRSRTTWRFLFVASLIPRKGIPYLLESIAILKEKRNDFVLEIVGDGPYRNKYEKYANELGIKDKVNFNGWKTKREIAQFMRDADVFVLSSIWENLPCVLIEAMTSGLPIIATKICGIPEIMNKRTGIMVPPKDKEALSSAISYMLDHAQNYSKAQIASYAKKKFSFEVIGKQFADIYKELLNKKRI
jgi:glycosyltransferase involved in cell wall biosynthesis